IGSRKPKIGKYEWTLSRINNYRVFRLVLNIVKIPLTPRHGNPSPMGKGEKLTGEIVLQNYS
ncbi:MAG: hypothetical protein WBA23_05525, partial [Tunicatimonas sp.]|uniref:hypothetical protein n=1 Tax=Tunicatimonas sp. TaxID=1940096 RepID=UPI003C73045A